MPNNEFCKKLTPFVNNAQQFCAKLHLLVSGAITFDSSSLSAPSTSTSSLSMLPSHSSSRKGKRNSEEGVDSTKCKKRKTEDLQENLDRLQEEISEHQIGT